MTVKIKLIQEVITNLEVSDPAISVLAEGLFFLVALNSIYQIK